jgi:hypothetical protein
MDREAGEKKKFLTYQISRQVKRCRALSPLSLDSQAEQTIPVNLTLLPNKGMETARPSAEQKEEKNVEKFLK